MPISNFVPKDKPQILSRERISRAKTAERGYGARWRTASALYLKAFPMCQMELTHECPVLAELVDHIVPHKGDRELFWDRGNWQGACRECHDLKTVKCDGGFGRPIQDYYEFKRLIQQERKLYGFTRPEDGQSLSQYFNPLSADSERDGRSPEDIQQA